MPSLRQPRALSALRAAAFLAAGAVILAGCSSGAQSQPTKKTHSPSPTPSPSPTSTVSVPPGVSLTAPGSKLSFGGAATVIYDPDKQRGTVLRLTAQDATRGRIADLSGFVLNDYTKNSTPYYVHVSVSNVGKGRIGGGAVPLYGVDESNTLLPPATFKAPFKRCPSKRLPDKFGPGDSFKTCLVFLAPKHGTMSAVSYRPDQSFDPITWTGHVAVEPKKH